MIKSLINNPEELRKLYIDEGKSLKQIGDICGVAFQTVHKWMNKNNIKTRDYGTTGLKFPGRHLSQETKDKLSKWHTGRPLSPEHKEKVVKALSKYWVKGEKHHSWRGGKHLHCGYVFLHIDGKNVREHRYVMEKHLGRKLNEDEHIHHINGIRNDNRLKNLQIVSNQEHALITWTNPETIKKQSERLKKIRAEKWWSTSKKK